MAKYHLTLQPTEAAVLHAATRIYAAKLNAGTVPAGQEATVREAAIEEAIAMAKMIDDRVVTGSEMC